MTIVFLLDVYYCVIVAWTFFYLASCFISFPTLPWESCSKLYRKITSISLSCKKGKLKYICYDAFQITGGTPKTV